MTESNQKEKANFCDILRLLANRVSFVACYKTMNEERREVLNSVVEDLIWLSNKKNIKRISIDLG